MPDYFAHVNAKRVCYGPEMFLKSNDSLLKSGAGERNKQSPSQMAAMGHLKGLKGQTQLSIRLNQKHNLWFLFHPNFYANQTVCHVTTAQQHKLGYYSCVSALLLSSNNMTYLHMPPQAQLSHKLSACHALFLKGVARNQVSLSPVMGEYTYHM